MSLADLQNYANALQNQVNQLENENRELMQELSVVERGVLGAMNELEAFNAKIRNTFDYCANSMTYSHDKAVQSIVVQGEIEELYTRFKQIELANKKIRACNNKKYYDFANYRAVRKIVQGIMDNLDLNMISNRTIFKAVEVQHLQTPDFWLTCSLIAVMAWKNDDKRLADRALAEAIKLDKKNTSLFFMLFNLRVDREDAALKWFESFQECEMKGSDEDTFLMLFTLITKTIADRIEDGTQNAALKFIKRIYDECLGSESYDEGAIVSKMERFYEQMIPHDTVNYPLLQKHLNDYSQMAYQLMLAKNNISILEYLMKLENVKDKRNGYIKQYIDQLVSKPNEAEKSVYDEIEYNEHIIKYQGYVDQAKEAYDEMCQKRESEIKLVDSMVDWIQASDNSEKVNDLVKLNMFTMVKPLEEKAINNYAEAYRARLTHNHGVKINDYSATVDFKNEEKEKSKVKSFYEARKEAQLKEVKNTPIILSFILAALSCIGAIALQIAVEGTWLWILGITGVCALIGVIYIFKNKNRRGTIILNCEKDANLTLSILEKLFLQYGEYMTEYDEYDGYFDRVVNELAKI